MLTERVIHGCSQLVYLDLPAVTAAKGSPTVGGLADYYRTDPVGRRYLKARFGSIPREYEGWKEFLDRGVADLRDYRIRYIRDDNKKEGSGFYGCGYLSPDNQLVIAFRGSEMLGNRAYQNDYHTDLALAYAPRTPQQKLVEEYYAVFDDLADRPHYLTGHSLGGNLAAYGAVMAAAPRKLLGCYCFNGPGFNQELLADVKGGIKAVADRLFLMQNEHDVVSSLLLDPVPPVVLASRFHPGDLEKPGVSDLLYPHSNFVYQVEGERFVRAGRSKDAFCNLVSRLTDWFLLLPGPVKQRVAKMVLEVLYSAQPPQKQLEFLMEGLVGAMVETGAGSGLTLNSARAAVRQAGQGDGTALLYRQLLERTPESRGGPAKAVALLIQMAQQVWG